MGRSEVTIGVDIGSTSVKAVAADDAGRVIASTRIDHDLLTPDPGTLEHDAVGAWYHGARRAAIEVAEAATAAGSAVVALEVAAMVPSLCAVDASGVPVSGGLLYGDSRAAATGKGAEGCRGLGPAEDGEFVRMLRHLHDSCPDAAGYWPAQAVANAALSGVGALDTVTAMTTVPLFDYVGWDAVVAADLGVAVEQLPVIVSGSEPAGVARSELAPALAGAVVGGGTIDGFAEQIVAGADSAGDVLMIVGATLITWAVLPEWREAPGLWTLPHTAPGLTLIGGPSNAGGIARNWAERVLAPRSAETVDFAVDPDEIPVFVPHLRGERVPLHDPHLRGGFEGLSVAQGPEAMWRAVFEATGFSVRRKLELAGVGSTPVGVAPGDGRSRRIVATGGGSADDAWMQAVADTTGLPVDCVAEAKGAALGAAYLARMAAGLESDIAGASRWARVGRRFEPDPRWVDPCERRYQRFVVRSGEPYDHRVAAAP